MIAATFVPSLLAGLGFTSTTDAQLLTVPVYAVGAIAFIFCGRMSDKTKLRGPFIAGSLFFGVIGYIMLAVAPQVGVRYAAVFIAAIASLLWLGFQSFDQDSITVQHHFHPGYTLPRMCITSPASTAGSPHVQLRDDRY